MKVQLDKWYFDCQTPEQFGYYYVSRLRLVLHTAITPPVWWGRSTSNHAGKQVVKLAQDLPNLGNFGLVCSEVHHYGRSGAIRRFRMGRQQDSGMRTLRGAGAWLQANRGRTDLRIESKRGTVQGTWYCRTAPLLRPSRPLYQDENGWCDWKVWAPHAEVELTLSPDGRPPLRGTGYVDLVRVALPFWRIPIRSLCWGRLFAEDRWIVLFRMQTVGGTQAWAHAGSGWRSQVKVKVIRNAQSTVDAFDWWVDGRWLRAETVRTIERGPLLNRERVGRCVPMTLLQRLGSWGFEEKYWVESHINGSNYAGPMEEVRWHADEPHM